MHATTPVQQSHNSVLFTHTSNSQPCTNTPASPQPPASPQRHTYAHSRAEPKGTIASGIVNISNTILGSGMLAMPFAISSVGLGLGLLLILMFGLASAFSLWLLTHVARHIPNSESQPTSNHRAPSSFFALSKITYPHAAIYFDAAIAIKCFGVSCSYLVVIGDVMPVVLEGIVGQNVRSSVWGSRTVWILIAMLIVTPFAFKTRLNSLRYTSSVALVAVLYLVGIVIFFFGSPDYAIVPGQVEFFKLSMDFFKTLPIFVFAFTCHQNIFPVYNEIYDNSQSNMNVVVSASVFSALVVYYIIGSLGYLMYGDKVVGNIINMYPTMSLVTYGRLALAILFVFSYPIQSHPCRNSILQIISYLQTKKTTPSNQSSNRESPLSVRRPLLLPISPSYASIEQDDPRVFEHGTMNLPTTPAIISSPVLHRSRNPSLHIPSPGIDHRLGNWVSYENMLHYGVTAAIVMLSFIVSVSIGSLDTVLSIVGATGSTTICYILPGLFYYKIYQDQPWTWIKVGAVFIAVTGVSIMICCVCMQFVMGFSHV